MHKTLFALFLLLSLAVGNQSVAISSETQKRATDTAVEQHPEGRLSNEQFQSFLQALRLKARPEWESALRAQAKQILALSKRAQLSDEQKRMIEFAAKGTIQNWQINQWKQKTKAAIQLDQAEIDTISDEICGDIQRPKGWLLWNIFLAWPENGHAFEKEKTRTRLQEIRTSIISGADFADQASRFSQSSSRYRGGRIGWVRLQRIAPALQNVIETLDGGDYSPIVENSKAVAFYFAEKVRPAQTVSAEEQIEKKKQSSIRKKRKLAWASILKQARETAESDFQQRWIKQTEGKNRAITSGVLKDTPAISLQSLMHWHKSYTQKRQISTRDTARDLALRYLQTQKLAEAATEAGIQPPKDMKRWLVDHFRAQTEFNRLTDSQASKVSEMEIDAYYRKHQNEFQAPPQWDASLIQFDYQPANQAEVKLQAQQVLAKIRKGELSIAEAAKLYSTAPSAADGGRLGSRTNKQLMFLDPLALKTLKTMDTGQIEGLIPGNQKLIVLQLHGKSPASQQPLAEVRVQIQEKLQLAKRQLAGAQILSEIAVP